ncbi:hypothetical protein ACFT38_32155 [Streptomyces sp. NPDC056975]|uniref:hypothetical protein n=1 Tax=Streptomyces sp. NPDC056975 TaxID=3345985 RepID=UPI0036380A7D
MDDQVIAINENPRHRLTSPFLGSPAVEITGHDHRQPANDQDWGWGWGWAERLVSGTASSPESRTTMYAAERLLPRRL